MWGELELGARLARAPYLAVTGTNGKTTTTGMLGACLRAAGIDAVTCGNIGFPFTTAVRGDHEALVVEVSSFQLAVQEWFHPRVSVLVNLAPDHLDHHGVVRGVRAMRRRAIYAEPGRRRRPRREPRRPGGRGGLARRAVPQRWFGTGTPAAGEVGVGSRATRVTLGPAGRELGSVDGERAGHRADAAAAAAAALAYGVAPEAVRDGLAAFEPAAHRGEAVAEIDGVRFLDNSKATNVHAALAAIAAVRRCRADRRRPREGRRISPRLAPSPPICAPWSRSARQRRDRRGVRWARPGAATRARSRTRSPRRSPPPSGRRRGAACTRVRELGSVRRLRRARGPIRRRRPRTRGRGAGCMAERTGQGTARAKAAPASTRSTRAPGQRRLRLVPTPRRRSPAESRRIARRDLALLCGSAGALTVVGLVMVLSAGSVSAAQGYGGNSFWYFQRQVLYAAVGIGAAIVVTRLPPRIWRHLGLWVLGGATVLMVIAARPTSGTSLYGASRWIDLGPVTIQPSEFAKLGLVAVAATVLTNKWSKLDESDAAADAARADRAGGRGCSGSRNGTWARR